MRQSFSLNHYAPEESSNEFFCANYEISGSYRTSLLQEIKENRIYIEYESLKLLPSKCKEFELGVQRDVYQIVKVG